MSDYIRPSELHLLMIRRLTARLVDTQPEIIVQSYFTERRRMPYRGRRVIHVAHSCKELWLVSAPPPARSHECSNSRFLQEGDKSQVYRSMSQVIQENTTVLLPGMRYDFPAPFPGPPPPPSLFPPLVTHCAALHSAERAFRDCTICTMWKERTSTL
jgi:hypothetical protein